MADAAGVRAVVDRDTAIPVLPYRVFCELYGTATASAVRRKEPVQSKPTGCAPADAADFVPSAIQFKWRTLLVKVQIE